MLQEVTLKTSEVGTATTSLESDYQHNGPRHAAPTRGAGRSLKHQNRSSLTPVQDIKDNAFATFLWKRIYGESSLDLLQFAWEPMDPREKKAEDVPWHTRSRFVSEVTAREDVDVAPGHSTNDTGGWPRERRGAWTERSDRDLAPSFAVELRDAINSLYGWDAPDVEAAAKFCTRKRMMPPEEQHNIRNMAFSPDRAGDYVEKIKDGMREDDKGMLRVFQGILQKRYRDELGLNANEPIQVPDLQFGTRAPRSLIHLGGKVPYDMEDRLALFEDRARGGKGSWP
ncbi:hypothetical protein CBS101457_000822 [Exobasidium rhododendri]|nr:hypothetical protein CBS101457_000822 [Exobasidium rhododendri]